eukprot:TRINITY_DN5457_c0_g1_i2.p1 TRINITY_DN5457_c0_g1~~TRINITY_DN5457_c0_g1_i2.p1  ORF type:complete len:311 (+),score=54.08 TRINITY_DN5457_c0_g1_i2:89-934(+)
MAHSKLNLDSTITMNDGKVIPRFGLGVYQAAPGESTKQAVLWAFKAGIRHVDSARIYSNEADVGQAVRESGIPREEIFVTTKLWDSDQGYETTLKAAEKSLEKLGLAYIDLYLIHSPNPGKERRLASWKAMEKLVADGKIKSIGVSNYGVHHLKELLESKPTILPAVNQIEVHPWLTRRDIVDFCVNHNIVVEAYSPLAKAQTLNDPVLKNIATKYSKTAAQILIRWSLQHNYVVIPKSVHEKRIRENSQIYDFELADEDVKALDALDRYFVTGWDPTRAP